MSTIRTSGETLDHSLMGKGKYKHLSASQVAEKDPQYLVWAYDTWAEKPCSELLYKDCKADLGSDDLNFHQGRDHQD